MSNERPVLFRGDMVRALLRGTKTQTRRVIKPRQGGVVTGPLSSCRAIEDLGSGDFDLLSCPYGEPGDRLWVRETFRLFDSHEECACYDFCVCASLHGKPIYRADEDDGSKWKPSIHMPRWASRILLEITDVRIERVQEIREQDARAEGVEPAECCDAYFHGFSKVWRSINGAESWDANPWVWVVEFRRIVPELGVSGSSSEDEESDLFQLLSLLADIREASDDNGQRMQSELVRYIRELRQKAALWDEHNGSQCNE